MIELKDARDYYLEYARRWSTGRKLKVDAHNEMYDNQPQPGGIAGNLEGDVVCVEFDQSVIMKARQKNPGLSIVQGDIRDLPFPDGRFDSVIDCSTIDHLLPEDVDGAVAEYARVLTPGGRLLLISWCSLVQERVQRPWDHAAQYWFRLADLRGSIRRSFGIREEETFYRDGDRFLHRICGAKCPGNI